MPRWRLPRPRFSLLTLLLSVIFIGACFGLWWRWEPWPCEKILHGHTGFPNCVSFSMDGKLLAAAGQDGAIRIWDLSTDRCIRMLPGHRGGVWCCDFSPDGQQLASSGKDKTVRLWDVNSGTQVKAIEKADRFLFSPDGRWFAVELPDEPLGSIRFYNRAQMGREPVILKGFLLGGRGRAFSENGNRVAVCCSGIEVWDLTSMTKVGSCTQEVGAETSCLSPDGSRLLLGGDWHVFRIWDVGRDIIREIKTGHADGRIRTIFSPDGKLAATTAHELIKNPAEAAPFTVQIWNVETGEQVGVIGDFGISIVDPVFSSANRWQLVTNEHALFVRIWDLRSFSSVAIIAGPEGSGVQAISPDSLSIAFACAEGQVRIYSRRRPEYWWGIAWLPESWVALLSGAALLAIAVRNLRRRRTGREPTAPCQP